MVKYISIALVLSISLATLSARAADNWYGGGSGPLKFNAVDTDPVSPRVNDVWFKHDAPPDVLGQGWNKATFPNRSSAFVEISAAWSRMYNIRGVNFVNDGTTPMTAPGEAQEDGSALVTVHYDAASTTYQQLVHRMNTLTSPTYSARLNYEAGAPEVQRVAFSSTPTSGYVWFKVAGGSTYTDPIAYGSTAADVQTQLRTLTGELVSVAGSFLEGFDVAYTGFGEPLLEGTIVDPNGSAGGTKATVMNGYITYTAKSNGTDGNNLYAEGVDGATAGAEVVTVVPNTPTSGKTTIRVQVEGGVTTVGQAVAALEASGPAMALVDVAADSGNLAEIYNAYMAGPNQLSGGTAGGSTTLPGLADAGNADVVASVTLKTQGFPSYSDEKGNLTGQTSGSTLSTIVGPGNQVEAYKFKVQGVANVFQLPLSIVGSQPDWTYPASHILQGYTTFATTYHLTFTAPPNGSEAWVWGSHYPIPVANTATFAGVTDFEDSTQLKTALVDGFTSGCYAMDPPCTVDATGTYPTIDVVIHHDNVSPAKDLFYYSGGVTYTNGQVEE